MQHGIKKEKIRNKDIIMRDDCIKEIRKDIENILEDSVFGSVDKLEDRLGNMLEGYLISTSLTDYWINITEMPKMPKCYLTQVNLQYGEHEDATFYKIDSSEWKK